MMVRVYISYADGHYDMERAKPNDGEALEKYSTLITEQEWNDYRAFQIQESYWYRRCRDLDNIIAKQQEGETK